MLIDYRKIADAVEYYGSAYSQIDAPWWVTEEVKNITRPLEARADYSLSANGKVLVASGEQSFLYLMEKGLLPDGKYMTVTPCFRNEDQGLLHRKQFMKCELIKVGLATESDVDDMIELASGFFGNFVAVDVVKTEGDGLSVYTHDIMALTSQGPVEIGSYGIRKYGYLSWAYGTGIAEPRLSMAAAMGDSSR